MNRTSTTLPDGVQITAIPAFSDNYIWCLHNDHHAVVVDPGDAEPVMQFCQQNNLKLEAVLITHHHHDHTGGIPQLVSANSALPVIGPANDQIRGLTKRVDEGDDVHLNVLNLSFVVIELPGHTLDHIGFYGHGVLFCGDTLFSGGCGRLFEGTPGQMLHSMNKLKRLPDDTKVYCAHEYTLANMKFALAVEPDNNALQEHAELVSKLRSEDCITLPTTMHKEKAINPFMRTSQPCIATAAASRLNETPADEVAVFAAVRKWKDEF